MHGQIQIVSTLPPPPPPQLIVKLTDFRLDVFLIYSFFLSISATWNLLFFDKILTDVRKFLIKHELPTSTCGVNTIVENIYFEHIE